MLDILRPSATKDKIERLSKNSDFPGLLDYLKDQASALARTSLEQESATCHRTQGAALILEELHVLLTTIRGK